jgi:Ni/Co efflux regulator RcnB
MNRTLTRLTLFALLAGVTAANAAPPGFEGRGGNDQRAEQRPEQRSGQRDEGWRGERGRDEHREERRDDRRDFRGDYRGDYRREDGREDRHDGWRYGARDYYPRERFRGDYYPQPYGYYRHEWRRGERLPQAYYDRPYIVRDYGAYRLYEPPRGCQWVRVDHDVLLTAIATGVVIDVLYDLYH